MFIYDNVHGQIQICDKAKRIIDTKEFQRLRNIKQLGLIYQVFISASHNRFEHSIGVFHLAKKYMDVLNSKSDDSLKPYFSAEEYFLISIAALIHDLGHGPFSHLFDDYVEISNHEYRSVEIFRHMNKKYNLGYTDFQIEFIKNVIDPSNISFVIQTKYLYQIVSNDNGIDVDRMDYIMRDTKMTGLNYGVEHMRIMDNTVVEDNELKYDTKCKIPIESFFTTRYILYKEICNHKTVVSIEHHIKDILKEIDEQFSITKCVREEDWEQYILLTDNIISYIDYIPDENLLRAKEILNDISERNILKLVGEIISDRELNIVSPNKNIVIIKTKIKYHNKELPNFVNDKKVKTLLNENVLRPVEHITKIMCKYTDNEEANALFESYL